MPPVYTPHHYATMARQIARMRRHVPTLYSASFVQRVETSFIQTFTRDNPAFPVRVFTQHCRKPSR